MVSDRDKKILALRRKRGLYSPQIAAEVGCSPATVVRVLRQHGAQAEPGRPIGRAALPGRRSSEARRRREEAIRLRKEGLGNREIAYRLGVSTRSVSLYLTDGKSKKDH